MVRCTRVADVRTLCHKFFFFNDTASTEIYTLSLHDALPICLPAGGPRPLHATLRRPRPAQSRVRSEEHTSELQSHSDLVCRLLLEKKNGGALQACRRGAIEVCSSGGQLMVYRRGGIEV